MDETTKKEFLAGLISVILKSPLAIFALLMNFLMGYGISFMIFDYRANPKTRSHLLHLAIGTGYSCLIFLLTSWSLLLSSEEPPTLEDFAVYCPRTMVVSFAILVIVMVIIIVIRERKRIIGGN